MAATAVGQRMHVGAVWSTVVRFLRIVGVGGLTGYVAGVIAAGIGSRLAMRIVSLVAGHEHYGELTEAEERVGQISTGGTVFLIFFGGIVGIGGALLFLASRRWLPWSGWRLGLAFGCLILLALGPMVVDGENFDFSEFGSPTLNILMFAALFLLFGILIATLFERLDRRVPASAPSGLRRILWAALLLFAVVSLYFGLLIVVAFTFGNHYLLGVMALYLLIAAPLLAKRLALRKPPMTVAAIVAAFPVVVGGAFLAMQLQAIYSS